MIVLNGVVGSRLTVLSRQLCPFVYPPIDPVEIDPVGYKLSARLQLEMIHSRNHFLSNILFIVSELHFLLETW